MQLGRQKIELRPILVNIAFAVAYGGFTYMVLGSWLLGPCVVVGSGITRFCTRYIKQRRERDSTVGH